MLDPSNSAYPQSAYALPDVTWWQVDTWPGTNKPLGDEARIAAWLAFNKQVGDIFTTDELRKALGSNSSNGSRNEREHFQRRLRALRSESCGWSFPSSKHDRNLPIGDYRLERVGWHPALGPRPKDPTRVSDKTKRLVLERDSQRCFHCGVAAGEPYPGAPEKIAAMTVGHIIPVQAGGSGEAVNLRAECAACNESARSDTRIPESYDELVRSVSELNTADRRKLLEWVSFGHRGRDKVDAAFDRYRQLAPDDQARLADHLRRTNKR